MKKLLFLFTLILSGILGWSQNDSRLPAYGYEADRLRALKSLQIPTFTGVATAQRKDSLLAQIAWSQATPNSLLFYDPIALVWRQASGTNSDSLNNYWRKTGNAGTSTWTNFIGTTDNKGVTVRTNNKKVARFDSLQRVQMEWITAMNDTASDFEIVLIPDTQNMVDSAIAWGHTAGRSMFQWVKDNVGTANIKGVIGLGDITNDATVIQRDTADKWYDLLDDAGVMYVPTIGNHDYNLNLPATRNASDYLATFGPARIGGKPWYGGNYSPAPENFFTTMDLMGRPFGVMSLEYWPRDIVLAWADSVLLANPERTFFYVTHAYINSFGERSADTSLWGNNVTGQGADNSGQEQWDKFVKKHKNIAFTFNAHFLGSTFVLGQAYSRRFDDVGINGNPIHQFFANYQNDTLGGNGWFIRLQFKPKLNKVNVVYYSAYLNRYDQRFESFTYNFPNIGVSSDLAIQGSFNVNGTARFDSTVQLGKRAKYGIPFIGESGEVKDTTNFTYNYITGEARFGVPLTTDYGAYKIMIGGSAVSTGGLYSSTTGAVSTLNSNFQAVHGTGNFGVTVTRAAADNGGANLTYFKTRSADPTVMVAAVANDWIHNNYFYTVTGNGTRLLTHERNSFIKTAGTTYNSAYWKWTGYNESGAYINQMYLMPDAAISIGVNPSFPDTSAILDLQSTVKAFYPPRMTAAEMNAIPGVDAGAIVYNTDSLAHCFYNGSAWLKFGSGGGGGYTNLTQFIAQTAHRLFYSDAAGDVQELAFGSSGQYLKANGLTTAPSWETPAAAGEANTASNLGGGLANWDSKSGVDLRFNSFAAADFDLATNLISIDALLKADWNTAYTDRLKWDGGATGLVAATGRSSLGATTVGSNIFTSTNPSAITFLRANADNSIDWLSASAYRTAISAQVGLQFKDEAVNQGTAGGISTVDFTGAGVTATEAAGVLTVNIPGGGGTPGGADRDIQINNAGAFGAGTSFKLNSDDELLVSMADAGAYRAQIDGGASKGGIHLKTDDDNIALLIEPSTGTHSPYLLLKETANNGTAGFRITNAGNFHVFQNAESKTINIGGRPELTGKLQVQGREDDINGLAVKVNTNHAGTTGLTIQLAASQTADALQIKNSGATTIMGVDKDGIITGNGSGLTRIPKVLASNITDVGNVLVGEDDLMSYAIPGATLSADGDYLEFTATVTFAANANNKQVKLFYGATQVYASGAQAQNGGTMELVGRVIRTGAATQRISVSIRSNTTNFPDVAEYTTAAETLSGSVTIKLTGEATATNDIVQKINTVEFKPKN